MCTVGSRQSGLGGLAEGQQEEELLFLESAASGSVGSGIFLPNCEIPKGFRRFLWDDDFPLPFPQGRVPE